METREDRWFVRFRGHTLGPLTTEQVKTSLRKKELGASDKIASARNPSWCELSSFGAFRECLEGLQRPEPPLVAPPSPQILWKKKKASLARKADLAKVEAALPPRPPQESFEHIGEESPNPAAAVLDAPPAPDCARETKRKADSRQKPKPLRKARKKPARKPAREAKKKAEPKAVEALPPEPETTAFAGLPPAEPETTHPAIQDSAPLAEPLPAAEPAPSQEKPAPSPDPLPDPALARETLSLLGSLKEWSHREQELALAELLPPRPRMEARPADLPPFEAPQPKRLELHLTVSRPFLLLALILIAAAVLFLAWPSPKKMRDLENFRLPDPSSPTIQPSAEDDPIPSLKAPTRPKRE